MAVEEASSQRISGADKNDRINAAEQGLSVLGKRVQTIVASYEYVNPEIHGKILESITIWQESGFKKEQIDILASIFFGLERRTFERKSKNGEIPCRKEETNFHTGSPEPKANHHLGVGNHSLGAYREHEIDLSGVSEVEAERFNILEKGLEGINSKFFLAVLALLHDLIEDGLFAENEIPQLLEIAGIKDQRMIDLCYLATLILTKPPKPEDYVQDSVISNTYYGTYCYKLASPNIHLLDCAQKAGITLSREDVNFLKAALQWVKLNGDMVQNLISPQSKHQQWKFKKHYLSLINAQSPSTIKRLSSRPMSQIAAYNLQFLKLVLISDIGDPVSLAIDVLTKKSL